MKALVFNIRLNSLYSIRVPFTWQSSLTYPILPPSAIIGLIANAVQRYKNDKHPIEYLKIVENSILWTGSRLISPCVIKSYITSAIVKWEDEIGGKFTNALGRQFAYARELEIVAIFKEENLYNGIQIKDVVESLKGTPLTCGDSESLCFLDGILIKNVEEISEREIDTNYPVPFTKETQILSGKGQIFLMHERCMKVEGNLPLIAYIVPIEKKQKVTYPTTLKIRISTEKVFKIHDVGFIVMRTQALETKTKKSKRKK